MMLRNVYRCAQGLVRAVHVGLGLQGDRTRWPISPRATDLAGSVVTIGQWDEQWVAYVDPEARSDLAWGEFDAHVRSLTMAALAATKNLRDLSRGNGVDYSVLWRAKEGRVIPESVIDLMGKVPKVILLGPHGPLEVEDVVLTREEAVGLLRRPVTPEQWFGGAV